METQVQQSTVKEIQESFRRELISFTSQSQLRALNQIGFSGVAPENLQQKFPLHKIIHRNRIIKLCEKYNLIFTDLKSYTESIPQKNINEIEQFVNRFDYFNVHTYGDMFIKSKRIDLIRQSEALIYSEQDKRKAINYFIVAPESMIVNHNKNLDRTTIPTFVNDPIIIAMVAESYGFEHIAEWGVIVTAWGDEASHEEIINPENN